MYADTVIHDVQLCQKRYNSPDRFATLRHDFREFRTIDLSTSPKFVARWACCYGLWLQIWISQELWELLLWFFNWVLLRIIRHQIQTFIVIDKCKLPNQPTFPKTWKVWYLRRFLSDIFENWHTDRFLTPRPHEIERVFKCFILEKNKKKPFLTLTSKNR